MVAGSILPVSIYNNKLYFLFGKENPLEDSAKGWSDFGGGVENDETPFQTAVREGGEELTGFLGDGEQIKKLIKKNGGFYKLINKTYHVHMFFLEYDENLPKYYNQNHRFLWNRMNHKLLSDTKLFEKIEIEWFSIDEIKNRKKEFRNFYQEIVDDILSNIENIEKFILKKSLKTRKNKTRKQGKIKQGNKKKFIE
jgi:8-oxo-dGTP pyrophosphatase MutT (NUDIX family)